MTRSESVKKWRKSTKSRIVESMGCKCQICGYNRCNESLELHHIDPSGKEFTIGKVMSNGKSWDKIVKELRKCIMVCRNCHTEIHAGVTDLPETFKSFNEDFAEYRILESTYCVCGKEKPAHNKYCSHACSAKKSRTVDWDTIDVGSLYEKYGTFAGVGLELNISGAAVRKRMIKLGLYGNQRKANFCKEIH